MKTVIGLGNPGDEYARTRHNAGRRAVELLAKRYHYPAWSEDKHAHALVSMGMIAKNKVRLVLPQTFMNKSGATIRALALKPSEIILVHDDSDLLLGSMKLSYGKHSAGHNGVESVRKVLKTLEYWRIRIGIQKKKRIPAEKLVLTKFTPLEEKEFAKVLKHVSLAIECFFEHSPERAMSEYN